MPEVFFRSKQLLNTDDSRSWSLGALLAVCLLGAWLPWFFFARVAVYRVSDVARLEAGSAVHPIQATVAGRVVSARLNLGEQVGVGSQLVELDAETERRQLEEERTKLTAIAPQLALLRESIEAEKRALSEAQKTAHLTLDQARTRSKGADKALLYAEDEAGRYKRGRGAVPEIDLLRAEARARERRSEADTGRLEISRLEQERQREQSDRAAHIDDRKQEAARFEGQLETSAATIKRLEYEIEKRRIRAPITGTLAEVAHLRVGSFVAEGERLAAVVPLGEIRAVAEFSPSDALGLIRPGNPARIRLKGFPWAEYGSVAATVATVAGEIRGGTMRVELAVHLNRSSRIPFQHGLPATVEVEVERVSPAALVLRASGQLLSKPAAASTR
jgi:membrane fusion protein (multidrug efflux system)